jgi:hypothetical protein
MALKHNTEDRVEFSKHLSSKKKNKNKKMLIGFDIDNVESYIDLEKKQVRFYKKIVVESFGKHLSQKIDPN